MLSLLIASMLVTGGFDAGGHVGILFPTSGLQNSHSSTALFGVSLGYETGRSRVALDYGYAGLQAKQASPYRFDVNELSLGYGYEFARYQSTPGSTSSWGFDASAAAGYSLLSRTLVSARETGKAPAGHVAVGFVQRQGHSRLSLGLDNVVFVESQPAGSARTVSLTYVIALKAGVTYVF
ncbi:MAG: hypothetical protein NTX53_00460 [candidate division WOR-3 bacterium]|nr:hypothetical protein [candidate division WOR-3 bacterium]